MDVSAQILACETKLVFNCVLAMNVYAQMLAWEIKLVFKSVLVMDVSRTDIGMRNLRR